jgi:hypothetical protein
MNKKQTAISLFAGVLLLVCLISLSFAWYTATIENDKLSDLTSEGIVLTFNNKSGNTLKPDKLKEGVLNNTGLPSDYQSNKATYTDEVGNTLYFQEKVKLEKNKFTEVLFSVDLTTDDLSKVNALTYFDIKVYVSIDEINFESLPVNSITLDGTAVDVDSKLLTGEFYMVFAVSYKLPDELLPTNVVNSEFIKLDITATLQYLQ